MTEDTKQDLLLPGCRIRFPFWTGLLAVLQLVGAIYALRVPPTVAAETSQSVALALIGSMLWALLFIVVTVRLMQGRRYSSRVATASIVTFALYNVVRWTVFIRADYDRQRLPVLIFGTLCVVTILVAAYHKLQTERPEKTENSSNDFESQN